MHQPREQTVRHVHVSEGGQAITADQFHSHTGGNHNAESADQPHAQGSRSPALLGSDTLGKTLSVPGGERPPALPNARRQGKRRAERQ
jgi:hypothetical protein